jgi:hypothetical protein
MYFTECCEPIFNTHFRRQRAVLVGVGPQRRQLPIIVVSLFDYWRDFYPMRIRWSWESLAKALLQTASEHVATNGIATFLQYSRPLPVDLRHNSKINREQLACWAEKQLSAGGSKSLARSI